MGVDFLGHHFQSVRLEDRAVMQDYLRRYPQRVSGYSFSLWRHGPSDMP